MLKIKQFIFNPFDENTYLLVDEATRRAAVVDPGMFNDREQEVFDSYVKANDIEITQIINTHMHLDHCFGDNYVADRYSAKVSAHIADESLAAGLRQQCLRFGMDMYATPVEINVKLEDGDVIKIGDSSLRVIHIPGHSPGGIALYDAEDKILISGDSLFEGSIGRTDLPGGSHSELVNAVRTRLLTLPADTKVLPGHGPSTTIGRERQFNPYL
ncbi:MAG: MBL fold metallo-hydrolase [Bacteroidales bacterium]|nr:MBL fold metallo-hydrolase [Bacteroidales bacterium]